MNPAVYHHVFTTYSNDLLMKFFGFQHENDLEAKRKNFHDGLTMFNKSFLYFQLLRKENNEFIGWCGYHTWYIPHSRAEIGYGLTHEEDRGKGYMKEAFPAIVNYGFETMTLNRIEAFIGPSNAASLKLVERFGFTREGCMRKHYFTNGHFEDSVVFSLLKDDSIK
jgi:ribosomal-protein-alanine N-acetyltransferase